MLITGFAVHANPVISNLVDPASFFINHEICISELDSKLITHKKTALIGISGIGKTQLARMYAYKNQNKYNLIWFFDSSVDLNSQFALLAKEINNTLCSGGKCKLSDDINNAKQDVMRYLASQKDWLLVFDNLKLNQNNRLQDILSWEHNGSVIFCSQDSKDLPQTIKLVSLSKDDSLKLIRNILGEDIANIDDLIKAFNGNPVLTAQAAMFLKENKHITVPEYIKIINKSNNRVKNHVNLVFNSISTSAQNLLQKIALINNQSFSQELLKIITSNPKFLTEDISLLTRFGLINDIHNKKEVIFEMHDTIKEAVLDITRIGINKENVNDILDKVNGSMPQSVVSRYLLMTKNPTLKSNLEVLLENAEKYDANIYKIMELRQNLMNYYLSAFDYSHCQQMEDWFLEQEKKGTTKKLFMNDHDKSIYAWYLTSIGLYEDFAKSKNSKAIEFLIRAKEVATQLKNYPELNFTISAQLAQLYAYGGKTDVAITNIQDAEKIISENKQADLDICLYWFVKARIFANQGKYNEALKAIDKNIETAAHLPLDSFTQPTYSVQSEYLNFAKDFQKAYDVASKLYLQEKNIIKEDHSIHAYILVQIARAEHGLGKYKQALEHAKEAKEIFINDKFRNNKDLNMSEDFDLADALVTEADCLVALGKTEEAIRSYVIAEAIYFNKYRENMKNIDGISYMYSKAAIATCRLPNKHWYKKFSGSHFEKFGLDHPRSKEILKVCGKFNEPW